MNLKVRFKNPAFVISFIVALFSPVFAYFGLTAADFSSWSALLATLGRAAGNPYVLGMAAVSAMNALIDPTTPGLGDSLRALSYKKPGGQEDEQ